MVSVLIYFLSPELIPLDSLLLPFFFPQVAPKTYMTIHGPVKWHLFEEVFQTNLSSYTTSHGFCTFTSPVSPVSCLDPTHERRGSCDIWPIPRASLTLITFWGEFTLANHIVECTIPEILGYSAHLHRHALFLVCQYSYQLGTMHVASCKLLMKPKDHQTLSLFSWVGSGHETKCHQIPIPPLLYM